jgi:hypothetical protein
VIGNLPDRQGKKKQTKDAASELYTSPRFRLSRSLADHLKLQYFVVSAKYGLLASTEVIEPYDVSLELFNDEQRIAWADDILDRLRLEGNGSRRPTYRR